MDPSAKWYFRWPWTRVLMLLYCIMCSFVGLIGVFDWPSAAITDQLGYYAVLLYSGILVVSGAIGAIGIFRSIRATVISVWSLAAATFFHGASILAQGSPQTGLRLIIAPLMMVPLVWSWEQWLLLYRQVSKLPWPPWRKNA